MTIIALTFNDFIEELPHVADKSVLPFAEKHSGGRVKTLEMDEAVANSALSNEIVHAIGDVQHLHAVVGDPVEHAVEDFPVPFSVGFSRLLVDGWTSGEVFGMATVPWVKRIRP